MFSPSVHLYADLKQTWARMPRPKMGHLTHKNEPHDQYTSQQRALILTSASKRGGEHPFALRPTTGRRRGHNMRRRTVLLLTVMMTVALLAMASPAWAAAFTVNST